MYGELMRFRFILGKLSRSWDELFFWILEGFRYLERVFDNALAMLLFLSDLNFWYEED